VRSRLEGAEVLKEYLIGTGGWSYFRIPGLVPLVAYAKAFNFVEVNSTFYQIPQMSEVERWRRLVPAEFRFCVRAHRSITYKNKLGPVQENFEVFEKTKQICSVLGAEILHFQVREPVRNLAKNLSDFLDSTDYGKLRIALEVRGQEHSGPPHALLKTMQERDLIHSVDLSKGEMPAYESDTLYTRLFGKGKHNIYQPTDDELVEIDSKASGTKSERVVMSFHFVRMYKDAARLKVYKQTGKFPMITRSTGIASLEEVLREDTTFPATKQELVHSQGWKLFDLNESKRVHSRDFLSRLPEGTYGNVCEVVNALESIGM
jgi:uncharacterized protein YecE (DUF72 family)